MAKFGRAKYVPDNASMAAFLISDRVAKVADEAGDDILDRARDGARPYSRTGGLLEGYKSKPVIVSAVEGPAGPIPIEGGPRQAREIYNEDPAAAPNEFGNGTTPERRILRDAAAPFHTPRILRKA